VFGNLLMDSIIGTSLVAYG